MERANRNRPLHLALALALLIAATLSLSLSLVACGGSSSRANQLLRQTFSGNHRVESGHLGVLLTMTPSGGGTLSSPITLRLAGPFKSRGPGKLPASAFNINLATTRTGTGATITSIGSAGYVTFQGQSYKLPQATFQRLESPFAQLTSAPGGGNRSGMLGRLGIQPERWLSNPQIVGDEGVDGVKTTHIRSGINVAVLLDDLNTFLNRASSLGVARAGALPRGIPAADRRRIASEVHKRTFNVWTGVADKTVRRLEIDLTLSVSGRLVSVLGRSTAIDLTMQYADLNQPQSITAPTKLRPFSQFQTELRVLVRDAESGLVSGGSRAGSR